MGSPSGPALQGTSQRLMLPQRVLAAVEDRVGTAGHIMTCLLLACSYVLNFHTALYSLNEGGAGGVFSLPSTHKCTACSL